MSLIHFVLFLVLDIGTGSLKLTMVRQILNGLGLNIETIRYWNYNQKFGRGVVGTICYGGRKF